MIVHIWLLIYWCCCVCDVSDSAVVSPPSLSTAAASPGVVGGCYAGADVETTFQKSREGRR